MNKIPIGVQSNIFQKTKNNKIAQKKTFKKIRFEKDWKRKVCSIDTTESNVTILHRS